jgi:hypothetical protein
MGSSLFSVEPWRAKAPNSKHQAPGKLQAPTTRPDDSNTDRDNLKTNSASAAAHALAPLELEVWSFSGAWMLVLGALTHPLPPRPNAV